MQTLPSLNLWGTHWTKTLTSTGQASSHPPVFEVKCCIKCMCPQILVNPRDANGYDTIVNYISKETVDSYCNLLLSRLDLMKLCRISVYKNSLCTFIGIEISWKSSIHHLKTKSTNELLDLCLFLQWSDRRALLPPGHSLCEWWVRNLHGHSCVLPEWI